MMTKRVTIYMKLLNENVEVWRPIEVESPPDGGHYRVLGPVPETEIWEFEPDTIDFGKPHIFIGGERGIVAVKG